MWNSPPLTVDEIFARAGCVQLAVDLLQVLFERIDLVDDVQEVQLGRTEGMDQDVRCVAGLNRRRQLLDNVTRAGVGLNVRVVERIVLLGRELLDLGFDQGVVIWMEVT